MPALSAVRFDPADPEDLPAAWAVRTTCTRTVALSGAATPAVEPPPIRLAHLLATSEGGFWIARSEGRVLGFAAAIPRGPTWFLSELWVLPGFRGAGVGSRLYRLARRTARGIASRTRAALAGEDRAALVLGLRDGLLARHPILRLEGAAAATERLWKALRDPPRTRIARYDPCHAPQGRSPLLTLDRLARGAPRPQDQSYWLAEPGRSVFLLWAGGRPAAYFQVQEDGTVGPVAAGGGPALLAALRHAVRVAARNSGHAVLRVPAVNRPAMEALVAAGFRIRGSSLLLASAELGRPDLYLPADDSLF